MSAHRTLKKIKNKLGCSFSYAQAIVCREKRNCQHKKQKVVYVRPASRYYSESDIEKFFRG